MHIEIEGRDAFRAGIGANDCPYAFIKTPCYPNQTGRFDAEYRAKLDAWMRGWINERDTTMARTFQTGVRTYRN